MLRPVRQTVLFLACSLAAGCYPYFSVPTPFLDFEEKGDVVLDASGRGVWFNLPVPDAWTLAGGYAFSDEWAVVGQGVLAQGTDQFGAEAGIVHFDTGGGRLKTAIGGQVGVGRLNDVSPGNNYPGGETNDTIYLFSGTTVNLGAQYSYGYDWKWGAVGNTWRANVLAVMYNKYRMGGAPQDHPADAALVFDTMVFAYLGPPVLRIGIQIGSSAAVPFGLPEGPILYPFSGSTWMGLAAHSRF